MVRFAFPALPSWRAVEAKLAGQNRSAATATHVHSNPPPYYPLYHAPGAMDSGGASFCSCDPCLTANGFQLNPVDRATFFRHNPRRSRRRLPPRSGARAPPVAAAPTSPSRRTDHGPPGTPSDEEATPDDGELSDDSAGSSSCGSSLGTDPSADPAAGLSVLAALQSLLMLGINGVHVSLEHFLWATDDYAGFIFSVEYTLPREGVASLLKQRGSWHHSSRRSGSPLMSSRACTWPLNQSPAVHVGVWRSP